MMRRVIGLACLISGLSLPGCSSAIGPADEGAADGSAPDGSPAPSAPAPPAPKALALSLPDKSFGPLEVDHWERAFRAEGRKAKVVVSVDMTPMGESHRDGRQAEGIVDAARRSASLVVVPGPGIQPALEEAARLGTPMLALDGPLSAGGKPLPMVAFAPAEETAKALLDVAMDAAKAAGLTPTGPAIVIQHDLKDRRNEERAAALEAVLKAAKVEVLPRLKFDGDAIEAKQALMPALKEHPKVTMIFATDEAALPTLIEQRRYRATPDRFVIAGYTGDRKAMTHVNFGQVAALADLNLAGVIPIALKAALDQAEGKALPPSTTVPQPVSRALGEDLTDQLPKVPTIPLERPQPVKQEIKRAMLDRNFAPEGAAGATKAEAPKPKPAPK